MDSRLYPSRPIVGVGAVVLADDRVLLVRRRFEPLAGQWSLPGGALEVGETLEQGVAREVLEETGLIVHVGPMIEVFDRILVDEQGKVQYHFVLVDYLCRPSAGELLPGSDVDDAVFVERDRLADFGLMEKALSVIQRGMAMQGGLKH